MLRIKDAGFAAAMRGYFERELERLQVRSRPALHKRRATPWRRIKWALSHFLVNVFDYTRDPAAQLRRRRLRLAASPL